MAKYIGTQPPAASITVNGKSPDLDGNFQIGALDLGAAPQVHYHEITDITGLEDELNSKSDITHVHDYVTGVNVNGEILQQSITLTGSGDISVSSAGNVVTINGNAPAIAVSDSITSADDGTTPVKTFVGTQAEWDAFTKEAGVRYMAYII
jgi:hypothetical protein